MFRRQAGELRYLSFRHPGRKQLPGNLRLSFGEAGRAPFGTARLAAFRKPGIVPLLPRRSEYVLIVSFRYHVRVVFRPLLSAEPRYPPRLRSSGIAKPDETAVVFTRRYSTLYFSSSSCSAVRPVNSAT